MFAPTEGPLAGLEIDLRVVPKQGPIVGQKIDPLVARWETLKIIQDPLADLETDLRIAPEQGPVREAGLAATREVDLKVVREADRKVERGRDRKVEQNVDLSSRKWKCVVTMVLYCPLKYCEIGFATMHAFHKYV